MICENAAWFGLFHNSFCIVNNSETDTLFVVEHCWALYMEYRNNTWGWTWSGNTKSPSTWSIYLKKCRALKLETCSIWVSPSWSSCCFFVFSFFLQNGYAAEGCLQKRHIVLIYKVGKFCRAWHFVVIYRSNQRGGIRNPYSGNCSFHDSCMSRFPMVLEIPFIKVVCM